jgi:photosystem II stability/assembly factor-like uncharacterized protein
LGAGPAGAQALPAALDQPALLSPRASHALLLGLAMAGKRLVAVGERGVVLLSDDGGRQWRQARLVPASVTLTAVRFASATSGWAVGHLGVILHSLDGGETWQRQMDGVRAAALMRAAADRLPAGEDRAAAVDNADQLVRDGADKPFLDVMAEGDRILAVGAYGLAVRSEDGGHTWAAADDLADPKALHVYALCRSADSLIAAGEQGYLAMGRQGEPLHVVRTPHDGTFFGVAALPTGSIVAFGLGGALVRSDDGGARWALEPTGLSGAITRALVLRDGRVLLASGNGELAVGDGAGRTFRSVPMAVQVPITDMLEDGETLIVTGPTGPRTIPISLLGART